ncbi:hypothetical protein OUZ56_029965 [Daphnia magna]|uniref:Uncharacterized protein n=1 Tax=Daphnia magna TaxID=35525 RepID=A0ABR0B8B7_9CRUS|nr:hypothetical protein OUZ56_029965 [Daphnia magna]
MVSDINMVRRGRARGKSHRGRQLVSRRSEAGFATESYQAPPANPAPVLQRIVDELPEDSHQQQILNEEVEEMEISYLILSDLQGILFDYLI